MPGFRERVKKSGVWNEFTEFISQGSIIELGVGLVIGGAFSKVLSSFVDDILTPPLGLIIAGSNLENWFIVLRPGKEGGPYETPELAQQDGAVTENVGRFLMTAINFVLVAITLFLIIFTVNRVKRWRRARKAEHGNGDVDDTKPEPAPASGATQTCPWCNANVPLKAVKCMYCTSFLHEKVPAELLNKQPQASLIQLDGMDFPKINVSSKADIQYITQIWRKALYNRLEQQYANRSDPRLLQEVQLMLDQWLENMVKMASAGIDINGISYDEAIKNEDVEPLDESLTRRLQAQQQQVEELTLSVAERRKRVPEQVKMLLDDAIKRQSALADRIEFEPEEGKQDQNEDSDMENG
ncbi:hypothetical protein BGZ75_006749 [Mortierella antarctica]|nr:hypothetical protein BGZ75_006749 [Mortierella antarctica]